MIRRLPALLSLALLFFSIQACSKPEAKEDGLRVVVSIQPLAEFVEMVGGEKVDVAVMVPPGASPHTYEPRPSQLKEVSGADLFVKVGTNVEFELVWMDRIIGINRKMPVVDCSAGIELIGANKHGEDLADGDNAVHGAVDPHIWLSPKNAKIMVNNIYDGLSGIDPENKPYYAKRRDEYVSEIDALGKEIARTLEGKRTRKVMVYHPAWAYLAREYGLEEFPIEKRGKEATPAGIAEIVRLAREYDMRVIFASPEFSTRSAEVVANEIGGRVVLVSPLEKDYIGNLKKVVGAFSE